MTERELIDAGKLEALRRELGSNFARVVGYFQEDGAQSIFAIEEAARSSCAVALVRPAHTLKGDACQFGAVPLAEIAEHIEMCARHAVEDPAFPLDVVEEVLSLRPMFRQVMTVLMRETTTVSVIRRAVGFGRRMPVIPGQIRAQ